MLRKMAEVADNYAKDNNMSEVKFINIEVGEVAGVVPDIFTEYFDYIAEQYPRLHSTKLNVHIVPGEGQCLCCSSLYNIMKQKGQCPKCGSREKRVLSGRQVKIKSIAC